MEQRTDSLFIVDPFAGFRYMDWNPASFREILGFLFSQIEEISEFDGAEFVCPEPFQNELYDLIGDDSLAKKGSVRDCASSYGIDPVYLRRLIYRYIEKWKNAPDLQSSQREHRITGNSSLPASQIERKPDPKLNPSRLAELNESIRDAESIANTLGPKAIDTVRVIKNVLTDAQCCAKYEMTLKEWRNAKLQSIRAIRREVKKKSDQDYK